MNRLFTFLTRRRRERELAEEIQQHIDQHAVGVVAVLLI